MKKSQKNNDNIVVTWVYAHRRSKLHLNELLEGEKKDSEATLATLKLNLQSEECQPRQEDYIQIEHNKEQEKPWDCFNP